MAGNIERIVSPDGQRFILRDRDTGELWYCRPVLTIERADMLALAAA